MDQGTPSGSNSLLTRTELAARVNLSFATINRIRTLYGMPFIRIGSRPLYDWNKVQPFFERHFSGHAHHKPPRSIRGVRRARGRRPAATNNAGTAPKAKEAK